MKSREARREQLIDRIGLEGKVFTVLGTGASIGAAVVEALELSGATVACVDLDPDAALRAASGDESRAHQADVTSRADQQRVFDAILERHGRLDGVVGVVGFSLWKALDELTDEDWDRQLDLCLRQAFFTLQAAGPKLGPRGGCFTFISSISGIGGAPNQAPYGVAKAGLNSLVHSAAAEWAGRGVRVNAVAPSLIRTELFERALLTSPEREREILAAIPMGRLGRPEDVASAVLFLSSDLAAYVSGHILVCDGAMLSEIPWPAPGR